MSWRPGRLARADGVVLGALAVVVLIVVLAAAGGGEASLDERARSLEGQLRCPTCQGLSIADSPATSATQMRAVVREQLAVGASDDAVRTFFVARYGRWILLDPPLSGVDLALWLAPAAAIAIGALAVVRRARVRAAGRSTRRWDAAATWSSTRWPARLVGLGMVVALVIPTASALGPRLVGAELTGRAPVPAAISIDQLEAYVRAEPRDVEALVQLGTALLAADRAAEAAKRFRAALDVDRDNVPALLGIGTILLGADRPDAAGPFFDRVLAPAADRARSESLDGRVRFVLADGAALPAANATFDVAVSTLSMHHWEKPGAVLPEIGRVLRPGGEALIYDLRPFAYLHHEVDAFLVGTVFERVEVQREPLRVGPLPALFVRIRIARPRHED